MLSGLSKFADRHAATLNVQQLFSLPWPLANGIVLLWSLVETALAILVWWQQLLRRFAGVVLAIPLILLLVVAWSHLRDVACGCFGALPFFSALSFSGHVVLLAGMLCGFWYILYSATPAGRADGLWFRKDYVGIAGLILMIGAFATIPFTSTPEGTAADHQAVIDRDAVEKAIMEKSAVIVDARAAHQFELGRLPGAINIPYNTNDLAELISRWSLRDQAGVWTLIVGSEVARSH